MEVFSETFKKNHAEQRNELLIVERLSEEIQKVFSTGRPNINDVKSSLFDCVILSKVMKRLGINVRAGRLTEEIRNSIAHIDERLDKFDYKPAVINGFNWEEDVTKDGRFRLSVSINFQGAIAETRIGTDGTVTSVAPYGMIDHHFVWLDRNGKQQSCTINDLRDEFSQLISELKSLV
jgi:hypothetical protein